MPIDNQTPTFNLKAVVKETGLKPDTLRVWERRYGMPNPERTAGGHRLYSQQDIDMLKWMVARQNEGLSISRAVDMWKQLEAEGQSPLDESPAPAQPAIVATGDTVNELREGWLNACLTFDEYAAELILTQAFALYPPELACTEILLPALAQLGEGWYAGNVTVQQEHFASALIIRRLEALLGGTPAPIRAGRVIVGCPPEENHVVGPLLLTLLLRRKGWDVLYLGANVPLEQMEATIAATEPQLIVLSAQLLPTAVTLQQAAEAVLPSRVPLAYGGRVFSQIPTLRKRISGHFLGDKLTDAPHVAENLINSPSPPPHVEPVSEAYRQALANFTQQQPLVDATVWQVLQGLEIPDGHLDVAAYNLSKNIKAALVLDNLDYINPELDWIKGLLEARQLPTEILYLYLRTYEQALETHLDERGAPIISWLAQYTKQ